ncbi:transcription termination/antitermination protein NusG [Bradyrhizobium sp. HKCCYLRH3099]|uniref:transcription termination/antitermination protein NusG n=1 Tax=unclassified Bradyrhizobium TaxID=2631580 RepID=UPI003EBF1250
MLAMSKGNLGDVRVEIGKGLIVGYVDPVDPRMADMAPGLAATWHLIETYPNEERTVAAHLVARRFGIYVPEMEQTIVRRGRKVEVTRLMFTSLIFVFVWGIERHWKRIMSVPGVARIRTITAANDQIIPLTVPDHVIDRIRVCENHERPISEDALQRAIYGDGKKGRNHRGRRPRLRHEKLVWRTWDAFQDGINSVDSETRNQTLMAALSLPSQQPLVSSVVSGVAD